MHHPFPVSIELSVASICGEDGGGGKLLF